MRWALAVLGVAAILGAGCGTEASTAGSPRAAPPRAPASQGPAPVRGALEAATEQMGDGSSVTISKVTISGSDGYVVIHADNGGPGEVVGHARVTEGDTTGLVVALDPPAPPGTYWAMLHRDGGQAGAFEWPGGPDGPVRGAGISYVTRRVVLAGASE